MNKTTNTNKGTFTMKQLILKGLGKAKVKRIVKAYVLYEFNEFISDIMTYGDNDQVFQLHIGAIVQGFGLPEMDDFNEFTLDELLDFLGDTPIK